MLGVIITNYGNNKRLKMQLKHDAGEKSKDRLTTMRREVYLRMVEELMSINGYLAALPSYDLEPINIAKKLEAFMTASARLQLVAEPETAILVSDLCASHGQLMMKLMPRISPLREAKAILSMNEDLYRKANEDAERALSQLKRHREMAINDNGVFEALIAVHKSYLEKADKYAETRDQAWEDFNDAAAKYGESMVVDIYELNKLLVPVVVAIRSDLGLVANLEDFQRQLERQWAYFTKECNFETETLDPQ